MNKLLEEITEMKQGLDQLDIEEQNLKEEYNKFSTKEQKISSKIDELNMEIKKLMISITLQEDGINSKSERKNNSENLKKYIAKCRKRFIIAFAIGTILFILGFRPVNYDGFMAFFLCMSMQTAILVEAYIDKTKKAKEDASPVAIDNLNRDIEKMQKRKEKAEEKLKKLREIISLLEEAKKADIIDPHKQQFYNSLCVIDEKRSVIMQNIYFLIDENKLQLSDIMNEDKTSQDETIVFEKKLPNKL